jgi:hypothetical protein
MALATAAAIASIVGTGVGVGKSLFGGNGAQNQSYDLLLRQLEDSNANRTNTQVALANINRMGRAGFEDSQGSGLSYDPVTNTWSSKLGPIPLAAQNAADSAAIGRNTTDMYQAQGANARADANASRAQPLIDAAMRRMSDFRPTTSEELTSLLTNQAADANTQAYRPIIQAITQAANRSSTNAGGQIADVGEKSSADLRRGMIEARLAALQGTESINNQRRQGLTSDLTTAMAAGTPNFQYPTITPSTNNKDMLAALTSRANASGITSAYGLGAANQAQGLSNAAADAASKRVPDPLNNLNGVEKGLDSLSQLLKDPALKGLFSGGGGTGPGVGLSQSVQDDLTNKGIQAPGSFGYQGY